MSSISCTNTEGKSSRTRKKLGVIGGMGPAASAYFYELLTSMTPAETDQEHLEVYIISRPTIPDRTAFILGKSSESPVPFVIEAGNALALLGADLLAIPCATTHHFYDELTRSIKLPIIHMIRETAAYLSSLGVQTAGVMATNGAVKSGLFQKEMGAAGIRAVFPTSQMQSNVMYLIYDCIKAGKKFDSVMFESIVDNLSDNGSQAIILACTELSLIKRDIKLNAPFIDVLDVLARRCIELCCAFPHSSSEVSI